MGILLRVLVIITLILVISALIFGIMLFDRRELLKGRTQKLENTLFQLAPLIEVKTADMPDPRPEHPKRDTSPCTADTAIQVAFSEWWNNYKDNLELLDQPMMDLKKKENDLTLYYKINPIDGKLMKDVNGQYVTDGEGTMQFILTDFVKKTEDQLKRLNETREQLTAIRKELEDTVKELNDQKTKLRQALKTIVDRDATIEKLNGEIASLKAEIEKLKGEIATLNDTIREKDREIAVRDEKIADRDAQIVGLKLHIKALEIQIREIKGGAPPTELALNPGEKGKIVAVNNEMKFVMLDIDDKFKDELTNQSRLGLVNLSDMNLLLDVKRPGDKGDAYVTRISVKQINTETKRAFGDILENWQQLPINAGDIVYK